MTQDMVERVALEIGKAFVAQDDGGFDGGFHYAVVQETLATLNGDFDLIPVATAAITAVRGVTEDEIREWIAEEAYSVGFEQGRRAGLEEAARIAERMPSCEQNATGKWLNDPGMVAKAIRSCLNEKDGE